jgi:hypothetical protein
MAIIICYFFYLIIIAVKEDYRELREKNKLKKGDKTK